MRVVLIGLVAVALTACGARFSKSPTAAEIRSQGHSRFVGWSDVIQAIESSEELHEHFFGHICTGSEEWLKVAREIQTDSGAAHFSEEISSAAAAALPTSPEQVLRVFGSDACLRPEEVPSTCSVENWKERSLAALASVGPELKSVASACAENVRGY